MKNILIIGTFDILHSGHINLFYRASKMGNVIVGVTSDQLNRENPTKEELKFDEENRLSMIKDLCFIKKVLIIDPTKGSDLRDIVKKEHISAIAFGSDYLDDENKKQFAKNNNIELLIFPRTEGISSTVLRRKLNIE